MNSEWISVKEQLPIDGELVLTIATPSHSIYKPEYRLDYIVRFPEEGKYIWVCRLEDESPRVTHWMPLPNPPSV